MSAVTAPSKILAGRDRAALQERPSRQERRAERRRLKQQDRLSARLAELHAMSALLDRAAEVVGAGWVQGAWFTVATSKGERAVTAYDLPLLNHRPVTGACLVGSVVEAAGGPATVRSQLVQRTLDLVGHTLHEDPADPVQWCPGPRVRMLGVLELTHWNDAPTRTQAEVVGLLESSRRTVDLQRDRVHADRAAFASR
jgi:hypothetical protein